MKRFILYFLITLQTTSVLFAQRTIPEPTKFVNGLLVPTTVAPPAIGSGSLWYNATKMAYYNGSIWQYLASETFASANYTPLSRTITINGITYDLTANRSWTISITETDPTVPAYSKSLTAFSVIKSSTDPLYEPLLTAGTSLQYYRGDKTFQTLNSSAVTEGSNLYFLGSRVLAASLSGFVVGANSAISSGDNVLGAFTKVQGQIAARQLQLNGTGFVKASGLTISYDNSSYEPAFVKNTGFNKSFGSAAGTVVEGNDSRVINGQTAYTWGNHTGLYPTYNGSGANGTWGINISGNATSATGAAFWGDVANTFETNFTMTTPTYMMIFDSTSGSWKRATSSTIKSFLGIGDPYTKSETDAKIFGVTGASQSGTYTPTVSSTSNISSSSSNKFTWTRVGDIVTVFGRIGINATTTGTAELYINLPYGTILSNNDLNGNGSTQSDMGTGVVANGDSAGNRAHIQITITNASLGRDVYFSFQYLHTSL